MNIHPTVTERTGQATSPRGDTVPIVDVRETDTVVRVKEGGTVLIGGLISDRYIESANKVPILGNLPLVGGFFRNTSKETRRSDLVILLTPKILDVQSAMDYTRSRMENQDRLRQEQRK
jgi:type II secretory pathway component GspD/PulD (secretin)